MKSFILVCFSLLAFGSNAARSLMITETWRGEVAARSNNTTFAIGDIITWTVMYGNSIMDRMAIYSDGVNTVSDRGLNDDTLSALFCLDALSSAQCDPGYVYADGFFALYNAASDIKNIHERMLHSLKTGERPYDYWSSNRDNRTSRHVPWGVLEQYDYWADDFRASADNYPFRCVYDCPNSGDASFLLSYLDAQDVLQFSSIGLRHVTHVSVILPSTIPEPTNPSLIVLGVACIFFVRMKSKRSPPGLRHGRVSAPTTYAARGAPPRPPDGGGGQGWTRSDPQAVTVGPRWGVRERRSVCQPG